MCDVCLCILTKLTQNLKMDKKTLVVLAPNGRRQTVKANANTTILQVLEEVCKKQGLTCNDYDIKHHNKCLDTSTIIRFSGLPNNAQLELAEATKVRSESTVVLGLQLEDGTRLMGNFNPGDSIWEVLTQLCPTETEPDTNPVVIYMRREIYGMPSFQETTLRSLGLTSGRAMLRLIHRTPEELHTQANVSAPLPSRPVEEKPYLRVLKKSDSPPEPPLADSKPNEHQPQPKQNEPPSKQQEPRQEPKPHASSKKPDNFLTEFVKQEKQKQGITTKKGKRTLELPNDADRERTVAEEDFVFLGTRSAMIFSQETAQAVPTEDLPDDFFELTVSDAKKLLRDIKKQRLQMESAPLQTRTLRNLEESKKQLTSLNRYKQSIIRVNFPDHTVLQGTFSPVDTVSTVLDFVREYLEDKAMQFYLYTAPPKNILNGDSRLLEIGCVPNAVLHFGTPGILSKDVKYLRSDLLSKFTTASIASLAAARMRQQSTRPAPEEEDDVSLDQDDVNVGASTSTAQPSYEDYPDRPKSPHSDEKVPKWFKPTNK